MIAYLELLDTPGEKAAFQTLYEMYVQRMYQIAFHITGDEASAEDMVHETFLSLTRHMDKLSDVQSRRTWNYILTALKHHCFDLLEKQKRVIPYCHEENGYAFGESEPEAKLIGQEQKEMIADLVCQLSYPYKEVLYLQYYNEMKVKEIAALLQIRSDHVRQIAKRAKEQLKKKMAEMGYER